MLSIEELLALDEQLTAELCEHQLHILTRLNREEKLEELFTLLGLETLLSPQPTYRFEPLKNGKIVVIGASKVVEAELLGVARGLGIEKKRLELYLDYDKMKGLDCQKFRWKSEYSLIMVGPMPHSGISKSDNGSIISTLEQEDGYPPVIRLGSNELKITKSNFREALDDFLKTRRIA